MNKVSFGGGYRSVSLNRAMKLALTSRKEATKLGFWSSVKNLFSGISKKDRLEDLWNSIHRPEQHPLNKNIEAFSAFCRLRDLADDGSKSKFEVKIEVGMFNNIRLSLRIKDNRGGRPLILDNVTALEKSIIEKFIESDGQIKPDINEEHRDVSIEKQLQEMEAKAEPKKASAVQENYSLHAKTIFYNGVKQILKDRAAIPNLGGFFSSATNKLIFPPLGNGQLETDFLRSALQRFHSGKFEDGFNIINTAKDHADETIKAEALYWLGVCYAQGIGVKKDEAKAFGFYTDAANKGNSNAKIQLGLCYRHGKGTKVDQAKAFNAFAALAKSGDKYALYGLFTCYELGIGVEKNSDRALALLKQAAALGYSQAMYILGCYYEIGHGVVKNKQEALKQYQRAADLGHASALVNLGHCYSSGIGVARNLEQAFRMFQLAANLNDSEGMVQLGYCYKDEIGVDRNADMALKWFAGATKLGNSSGYVGLGKCYQNGSGIAHNDEYALKCFLEAAKLGNGEACYILGVYYHETSKKKRLDFFDSEAPDFKNKGREWLEKAKSLGYKPGGKEITDNYIWDGYRT